MRISGTQPIDSTKQGSSSGLKETKVAIYRACVSLHLVLYMFVIAVEFGVLMGLLTIGVGKGLFLVPLTALGAPFLLWGYIIQRRFEGLCLVLL